MGNLKLSFQKNLNVYHTFFKTKKGQLNQHVTTAIIVNII
jgi:hypothetical protein